ncbi:MAG TPA: helix-turn-helix domain-containing protein, partial [Candidatus Limnocylindrales bacterium]
MSVRLALSQRPIDATLTVTKAARLLGVHPNTVRSWSDQGRLRFYRINPRGDRRYRLGDLQRFLAAAERPAGERQAGERAEADRSGGGRSAGEPAPGPRLRSHVGLSDGAPYAAITMLRPAPVLPRPTSAPPLVGSGGEDRHRLDLRLLAELSSLAVSGRSIERSLERAVRLIRQGHRYDLVGIWELRGGELVPLAQDGRRIGRPVNMPADAG